MRDECTDAATKCRLEKFRLLMRKIKSERLHFVFVTHTYPTGLTTQFETTSWSAFMDWGHRGSTGRWINKVTDV